MLKNTPVPRLNKGFSYQEKGDKNCMWRGREPWEQSEAGGVNGNERHLRHSPVSSPTEELRKG